MRLIDAEQYPCSKCETKYCFQNCNRFSEWLYAEVAVRCKDCKNSQPIYDTDCVWCNLRHEEMQRNGFCHEGIRGDSHD